MGTSPDDLGEVTVLLQRLETQRLPRALALKDKVDRGEVLDDLDINFLSEVFADAASVRTLVARNPQYEPLVARIIGLYKEITDKALQNEQNASNQSP